MNSDEHSSLPQLPQQSSADANTLYAAQNLVPLPPGPLQPRILLPGQESVTPTIYSDQTMPLNIRSLPANAANLSASSSPSPSPKAEPMGASIFYPPIPASYPNSFQGPPAPVKNQKHARLSRGTWLLVLPIGVALIAVVLALLVIPVSAFWLPQNVAKTASKSVASQPTVAASIPTPVPTAIPTPTVTDANSISDSGVTLTPGSFNIQNDCQPDNGYRCTVTLALSPDASDAVSWSASLNGVDHSFHPRRGRLDPGQQQQIIIYLYDTCPIDAEFDVAVKHQHLNVPLQCN